MRAVNLLRRLAKSQNFRRLLENACAAAEAGWLRMGWDGWKKPGACSSSKTVCVVAYVKNSNILILVEGCIGEKRKVISAVKILAPLQRSKQWPKKTKSG